jgi:cellulose synthase/poly-beta-1,6-N-acetylglucosamine synthase-like glycosyltransferase
MSVVFPETYFFLVTGLYAALLLYAHAVWQRLPAHEPTPNHAHEPAPAPEQAGERGRPRITVVVAARNEAHNLGHLLADLDQQTFADFEVVVSDDHSEDATSQLVTDWAARVGYPLRLVRAPVGQAGKKAAVARAVATAQGELLALTDADCRVGPAWLATIWQAYTHHTPKLIAGPVAILPTSGVLSQLQAVEQASLVLSGAVAMSLGRPNMANGANLAYPKAVFDEVGGFAGSAHIASGDDEFLLQKIVAAYPGQVLFLKSRAALVRTLPQPSGWALFQQRKRWASKWRQHGKWSVALPALGVFAYHLACVLAVGWAIGGQAVQWPWLWGHWLLKFLAEWRFLSAGMIFFGQGKLRWGILILQPLYSFYVVFTGIAANFGTYEWKGRRVKP